MESEKCSPTGCPACSAMGEGDRPGISQPVSCGPSLRLQKKMLGQVRTKPDVKHKDIRGAEDTERASFSHLLKKELWCWKRLLRSLWTVRSNQSILKEINPEYSLEGPMLKLQYFGHLMSRDPELRKIEGIRRKGPQDDRG